MVPLSRVSLSSRSCWPEIGVSLCSSITRGLHFKHVCVTATKRHKLFVAAFFHETALLRGRRCGRPCGRLKNGAKSEAPFCRR